VQNTLRATLAPSTYRSYSIYFRAFLKFCGSSDPRDFQKVAAFLQQSVAAKKSHSTVRMRAAACAYFLLRAGCPDFRQSLQYTDFMRGSKRLCPLPFKKAAIWNPQQVLEHIQQSPFPVFHLHRAQEALVLLLLATGLRVSDISKLGYDWCELSEGLRLPFLQPRKCDVAKGHVRGHFDLMMFPEARLCPVRTLLRMRDVEARIEGATALFLSSKGTGASVFTLRRWTMEILLAAGIKVTAGSKRSAPTSAAFQGGIPLGTILSSAGWEAESTFRIFYQRPLLPVRSSLLY
jgi:integrase